MTLLLLVTCEFVLQQLIVLVAMWHVLFNVICYLLLFQFRIFTAPFHFVDFADFWLADQLNSLSCVLLDFEFLICYYAMEVDWLGHDSKLLAALRDKNSSVDTLQCFCFYSFVVVAVAVVGDYGSAGL